MCFNRRSKHGVSVINILLLFNLRIVPQINASPPFMINTISAPDLIIVIVYYKNLENNWLQVNTLIYNNSGK